MARRIGRLNALAVSRAKQAGMYADGGGLYLQVTSPEARSWVYRYGRDGKEHYMGLGSLNAVGLSEARARATEARRLTSAGVGPHRRPQGPEGRATGRGGQAGDFRGCGRGLHPVAQGRLAQCQARRPVAQHP